jgi:hypothetical protein
VVDDTGREVRVARGGEVRYEYIAPDALIKFHEELSEALHEVVQIFRQAGVEAHSDATIKEQCMTND